MSPKLLEIQRKAAGLPVKDREMLAERLMRSVSRAPLTQVEEAWEKEAERRFSAWRRGEREGVPAERAFKQIRKDLGW
jgi:putative addiction module component (TIGR02574 family)